MAPAGPDADMDPQQRSVARRTFWACFAGWALDGFDVQLYSFAIPALIALWSLSTAAAGWLATAALVTSALGGWGAGLLADRIGRARTLRWTVAWFAVFTGASALTQNFDQLLVARALQGLGFGGEWVAGAVLIGEIADPRWRGRAVGGVQSAWAVGWGAATIAATACFALLPQAFAWRALFAAGLLPALSVLWMRRAVPESRVFVAARLCVARGKAQRGTGLNSRVQRPAVATVSSPGAGVVGPVDPNAAADPGAMGTQATRGVTAIFRPPLLAVTLRGSLLAIGAQSGYYAIATWLPSFLRHSRGLSVIGSGGYLAVVIAGSFAGYLASAWLCDALGRRRNLVAFAVGALAVTVLYTRPWLSLQSSLVVGFPLGFFASGLFSGLGPLYTELYPTAVRAGGQGFCYNFGRGVAALAPAGVGALAARVSLGAAIGVFAAAAYGLVVLAALSLPETRGRAL